MCGQCPRERSGQIGVDESESEHDERRFEQRSGKFA